MADRKGSDSLMTLRRGKFKDPLGHSGKRLPLHWQDFMSTRPSKNSSSDTFPETLTSRVAERVATARLAIDRGAKLRPRSQRKAADASAENAVRETKSLKRVFRDMGTSYRRYRSQTGEPVVPGLKDAAYRFRAEPSLSSLVAVAAYLDDLDLLS
jgi:hypothetical protein